jgi:hypothetical protein
MLARPLGSISVGGASGGQGFCRAARRAYKKGPRGAALSLLLRTTQGQGWRAPS